MRENWFDQLEDGSYIKKFFETPYEISTLWQPQLEDFTRCIKGLDAKANPETRKAYLPFLKNILRSGRWVNKLGDFLFMALNNLKEYEEVIDRLLHASPKNRENIERFFKSNRDKIFDLVKSSDRLGSQALSISVDVFEGREVLDKLEEALEGEGAERVLKAVQGYGWKLHGKFKKDFRDFLQKALDHESEKVRQIASNIMREIQYT